VEELPVEIDKDAPQVIGSVTDEAVGNKFIRFFRFSGLQTCGLIPREENDGFDLVVSYLELERALEVIRGFANLEDSDEIDLEKLMPMLDEQMEDIQKEEANELLSDLRTEASTVYVNKKDAYSDLKFSGYSFIGFAVLGYLFAGLNLAGVISLFTNFSMIILVVVFTVFLLIGISSFRKASRIKNLVSEEESAVEKVQQYINEHFTDEYLSSLDDDTLSEEENFFHVTEVLKGEVSQQFPLFSKGYIDQLVDEKYGEYCDNRES
jgi:hypothetical protein